MTNTLGVVSSAPLVAGTCAGEEEAPSFSPTKCTRDELLSMLRVPHRRYIAARTRHNACVFVRPSASAFRGNQGTEVVQSLANCPPCDPGEWAAP